MKRLVALLPIALLMACVGEAPEPCMSPKEIGTVVNVKDYNKTLHGRYASVDYPTSNLLVEVKGVIRVCRIDEHTEGMMQHGMKVSLTNAERLY